MVTNERAIKIIYYATQASTHFSYILILHTRIVIINEARNGIDVGLLLSCSSLRQLINAESNQHINEHSTKQQQL